MEQAVYSEAQRDRLEQDLANKRELIFEQRHGMSIIIYWLRLTNSISMMLINERNNSAREFEVPTDQVLQARDHPEVYAGKAGMWAEPIKQYEE